MTLTIETEPQYKALFDELAKAIGASIHIETEPADSEQAVLDRIERSYRQVQADVGGQTQLQPLSEFLSTIN